MAKAVTIKTKNGQLFFNHAHSRISHEMTEYVPISREMCFQKKCANQCIPAKIQGSLPHRISAGKTSGISYWDRKWDMKI